MAAPRTSFHDITKVKIEAAAMPGIAMGSTTFRNAWNGVHPKIRAASSTSAGTPTKTLAVMRIAVGRASAECSSTTAMTES
jgi:hypothetical protein